DRKSTRLNSSHVKSSYAVFCLKKTKRAALGIFLRRSPAIRRDRRPGHGRPQDRRPASAVGGAFDGRDARLRPRRDAARGASRRRGGGGFFFSDPAPTEIYTLSLHDALPI